MRQMMPLQEVSWKNRWDNSLCLMNILTMKFNSSRERNCEASDFMSSGTEAVVQRCSVRNMFLKISQNSQKNTCVRVFFLIKLQNLAQVLSCEFCKVFKNSFFIEHLWWLLLSGKLLIMLYYSNKNTPHFYWGEMTAFECLLDIFSSTLTLREKCPYSELFWPIFSSIRTKYGKIRTRITPNTDTFYAVLVFIRIIKS